MDQYANALLQTAQLNNSWSAEQAQKQMEFQERLSNTAHQREIADLKAAGLNPVLSASHNGASTPSGAMGSTDTSLVPALAEVAMHLADAESAKAHAASSGSGSAADQSADLQAKDVNSAIKLITGRSNLGLASVLTSAINQISNMDTAKLSHAADKAGKIANDWISENSKLASQPKAGTSAAKAKEYNQRTGQSSTKTGLDWIKGVANGAKNLFNKVFKK